MSQHTPKAPMDAHEINMHKPVCAEYASFRAGIRCAERVYQVNDLVRQVNYWTDEWSDVRDQNQSLRNQIERLEAELAAIRALEPVAWINQAGDYVELSSASTVYGSHTVPLVALLEQKK